MSKRPLRVSTLSTIYSKSGVRESPSGPAHCLGNIYIRLGFETTLGTEDASKVFATIGITCL
jgi:hypothetical protein